MTKSPCNSCKLKRAKCDENRPTCGRCAAIGTTCVYPGPDLNWADRIRAELTTTRTQLRVLQQVIDGLRSSNDEEAAFVLARLRLGEPIDALARSLLSSTTSPPPNPRPIYGAFQDTETRPSGSHARQNLQNDSSKVISWPSPVSPQSQSQARPDMLGDFLFPAFDCSELYRVLEGLFAEEVGCDQGRIILLDTLSPTDQSIKEKGVKS